MAWFVGLTFATFGTLGVQDSLIVQDLLTLVHPVWQLPVKAMSVVGGMGLTLLFFIFPNGRLVPRGLRWPVSLLLGWQFFIVAVPGTPLDPALWPPPLFLLYWTALFASFFGAQIYRYRRVSTPLQRQQTKWAVLGFALALGGSLAGIPLLQLAVNSEQPPALAILLLPTIYYWFLPIIPLFIGVAILRSRLWDIDVLIRRTLVYSVLTGLLALVYLGSVVVIQAVARGMTGSESPLVIVLSTLLIAALFGPLRTRVQRLIDRRFYRRKYDAARTLQAFGAQARDETDLSHLTVELTGVVQETMQPAQTGLWLKPTGRPSGAGPSEP
jgi:hypothetical protein